MHANVERIRTALKTIGTGDRQAIAALMSPDIVWHVGGDHPLSGDYEGRDAALDYLAKARDLTGGTLTIEPLNIMADDTHAAIFLRVKAKRGDRSVDTTMAEALRLDPEGRWTEYWALADDQAAVDQFWS